jgi:hypothetical protein
VYIGFYGKNKRLYDTAGPYAHTWWTTEEHPTKVQGVAVDPAFVVAMQQQMADNNATPVQAYVQLETGVYNDLVGGIGFHALKVLVLIALITSFLYGSSYFWIPLLVYVYAWWMQRSVSMPAGYKSPRDARFWRPFIPLTIRLASMYCLVAWMVNWQYKSLPPSRNAVYYSSLYSAIVGFSLMVYRWHVVCSEVSCA